MTDTATTDTATQIPRVLVVEDSATYAALLARRISDQDCFQVTVAKTLADARAELEAASEPFFAAVCDLHLPDAEGGEIVDFVLQHVPTVLVMTASLDEETRQRIISKNVADYVVKETARDVDYLVGALRRLHRFRGTKVLLVDDSPTYRRILQNALEAHRYDVLIAHNGEDGLALLESNPDVRLVVTDYNMEGMDGFELVSRIRRQHGKNQMAVIGLSAQSGDMVSARFLKKGANDFLVKPFSKEEFFCRVTQNLEMIDLFREIQNSANRDYLTGLFNRRHFYELGQHYFENALRNNLHLSAVMMDIDFFKTVNDTFGHDAGDEALRMVARTLEHSLRKADVLARFGGEEFCALVVNIDVPCLQRLLERLRAAIAALDIRHDGRTFKITISIGATHGAGISLADMIRLADDQLYRAKDDGRNRVRIRPEDSSA